ncbi:coiled-coil-helix-coiled-coil-helix domain-containing protein 7 [Crotalus adamanteus]|uniref:Coiled-coil-helix-coiled-coil-helix domain-containing protein 7 n=3 Tax=Crotalus TaxID=8728 RepID=A0AAW1BMM1_CROAD|nr:coiled-coil-helix-coiled-coil-helix domain-containing protein 7 isoform X1 [Crotalus tigris]XP_039207379.1 coiled-coil-helix-coiled-coil-helix domain-containing protein 7 isoform X1 [Crotalus tigris]
MNDQYQQLLSLKEKPHTEKKQYNIDFMSPKHRLQDHDINPCLMESDASRKCLEANQSNKDMCAIYFLKYKSCRKFWHGIMMQRRQDGIKPHMPIAEERKRILASLGEAPY